MSEPPADVTTPLWSGDLKASLRRLDEEERDEVAALDRRSDATSSHADVEARQRRIEQIRGRYAAERRRLQVAHGLTLFVGD